jgi:hypothetical protein
MHQLCLFSNEKPFLRYRNTLGCIGIGVIGGVTWRERGSKLQLHRVLDIGGL